MPTDHSAGAAAPTLPESYATFWEPIPVEPAPRRAAPAADAYEAFAHHTEAGPVTLHVEQTEVG